MNLNLIRDEHTISANELAAQPHSKIMSFEEVLPLLSSPDSGELLKFDDERQEMVSESHRYPIVDGLPILYPSIVYESMVDGHLPLKYYDCSELQYFLVSQIKQQGEINSASSDIHYQRHLWRMKQLLYPCSGSVLDVGCDDVQIGSALFSDECQYVGLDPFSDSQSGFRIVGVGEFLPFQDESFDNVVFNTSLDHMLDYHRAVGEGWRVLKENGSLLLCTLIWQDNSCVIPDTVHFHHFKEYEIFGVLADYGFKIKSRVNYSYKGDKHRYGLYLFAEKVGL